MLVVDIAPCRTIAVVGLDLIELSRLKRSNCSTIFLVYGGRF